MPSEQLGQVMLVGAGPGAADLLTVRALRAIEGAQALLYDALISDEVLALTPKRCLRIRTGKRAGGDSMNQAVINGLMLKLARRGLKVVRLKGGDPSVFGRSGEEKDYLEQHGVQVEVVPGVTAASAAAAQFGFPLTHRGEARRLVFATARTSNGKIVGGGWAACADDQATLALYMARDSADAVADCLMDAGRRAATPALVIENAGRADARAVRTTLAELGPAVRSMGSTGPTLLMVGEVCAQATAAELNTQPADCSRGKAS